MRAFAGLLFILAGSAGSAFAQSATAPLRASYAPAADRTTVMLAAVNRIRRDEGLSELKLEAALMRAASDYAADLAWRGELSHAGADGSQPPDRAIAAGYRGRHVAENLAAGYDDVAAMMRDWMESPSHRATILLDRAADLGVGRAENPAAPGDAYWTLLVAAPTGPAKTD